MKLKLSKFFAILGLSLLEPSCQTSFKLKHPEPVDIPLMVNDPKECYQLDEFMPLPHLMQNALKERRFLRHYFYKKANYKIWLEQSVALGFYSSDGLCWYLFEEYVYGGANTLE